MIWMNLRTRLFFLAFAVLFFGLPLNCFAQNGPRTGDGCPVPIPPAKLYEETSFPGFDETRIKSFARSQDGVINCLPTALADFFCYHIHRAGSWPRTEVYKSGCSAMDMQLQLIKRKGIGFASIDEYLKYSDYSIGNDIRDAIKVARETGMCPEKQFPSEFTPRSTGAMQAYLAFQSSYQRTLATEGGVLGMMTCPECIRLAPSVDVNGIPISIKRDLGELVTRLEVPKNSFEALKLINSRACAPGNRVKMPEMSIGVGTGYPSVYKQLQMGNPVLVSLRPNAILNDQDYLAEMRNAGNRMPAQHAAIALGAYRNPKYGNQCYIVVKSSWRDECIADPPNRICLSTGAIAIRKDIFDLTVSDNAWVRVDTND
jgi:hypothetical protein